MDIEQKLNNITGTRLKQCRTEKNMSQKDLSELSNYSIQQICYMENGKRKMSVEAAQIFSEILNVRPEYLLAKDDLKTKTLYFKNEIRNMFAPIKKELSLLDMLNEYFILLGVDIEYKFKDIDTVFSPNDSDLSGHLSLPVWKNLKTGDMLILEAIVISYKDTHYTFATAEYYTFLESITAYIIFKIQNLQQEQKQRELYEGVVAGASDGYASTPFVKKFRELDSDQQSLIAQLLSDVL